MNTDDERAIDSTGPSAGLAHGRAAPGKPVDGPITNEPADASGLRDRPTGGPAGSGLPVGGADSDEISPSGGDQSTEWPVGDGFADAGDDDGSGVSPVVREYVERLRREALARDAGAVSAHCQYVAGTAPTTPPCGRGRARRRWQRG